jgi:hypothetical protein
LALTPTKLQEEDTESHSWEVLKMIVDKSEEVC